MGRADEAAIRDVLLRFYEAVERGHAEEAAALMTTAAREELVRAIAEARDDLGLQEAVTWEVTFGFMRRQIATLAAEPRLTSLQIGMGTATATLVLEARDDADPERRTEREPVGFRKVDGSWLLDVAAPRRGKRRRGRRGR